VGPLVASCPVSGPDKKSLISSGDMARFSTGTPCGDTGVRVKLPPDVNERSRIRGARPRKELVLNGSSNDEGSGGSACGDRGEWMADAQNRRRVVRDGRLQGRQRGAVPEAGWYA